MWGKGALRNGCAHVDMQEFKNSRTRIFREGGPDGGIWLVGGDVWDRI